MIKNGLRAASANEALVTDDMLTRYADFACAPGHRYFVGAIQRDNNQEGLATKDKLAAIKVPTLILWGEKDQLIPVGVAHKFADAIAGSKAIVYPGVGHIPHEEAATKSAADLRTFLEEHSIARVAAEGEKRH